MSDDALGAAEQFAPGRRPSQVAPLGSGHIHQTLRVVYSDGEGDLVLQQLNESVFPDLGAVMHNLASVTRFLRDRGAAPRSVPLRPGLRGSGRGTRRSGQRCLGGV